MMDDVTVEQAPRTVTNDGMQFVAANEGKSLQAYQDPAGVWTIGYGCTRGVYPGMVITDQQAEDFLDADLITAETAVNRCVTVPLSDNQFTALVDFTFNEGVGAFAHLTALPKLNQGDYASITAEMLLYNKITIGGQKVVSTGLVRRRRAEVALWNTPDPAVAT